LTKTFEKEGENMRFRVCIPCIDTKGNALGVTFSEVDAPLSKYFQFGIKCWKLSKNVASWPSPSFYELEEVLTPMKRGSIFLEISEGLLAWAPMPDRVAEDELKGFLAWFQLVSSQPKTWVKRRNAQLPAVQAGCMQVKSKFNHHVEDRNRHRAYVASLYQVARQKWNNNQPINAEEFESLITRHNIPGSNNLLPWVRTKLAYTQQTNFTMKFPVRFKSDIPRYKIWDVLAYLRQLTPLEDLSDQPVPELTGVVKCAPTRKKRKKSSFLSK
jgi:hypothetical protein